MDIRLRGFVIFLIGFLLVALTLHVVLWWMYGALARRAPQVEVSPLAERSPLPPEPRLQGSIVHPTLDREDLAAMRAQEDAVLGGYGWVNRQSGVVHIPIARAMEMVLERGLSTSRPSTQPSTTNRGGP